eukprot:CAMPEP_0185293574 /NCGR_PEP_ID=MMETSP1363-20130426/6950_1 /TAXON_ID=38817 /ORGANISM="Gephyrocapsa oceanica, Strain RCC1303" /LENGTH=89 /DNA_ID=CAMNT_0027889947 /DNA_START=123 /DNA_END=388 /DNA_ORIENTATION=+
MYLHDLTSLGKVQSNGNQHATIQDKSRTTSQIHELTQRTKDSGNRAQPAPRPDQTIIDTGKLENDHYVQYKFESERYFLLGPVGTLPLR